MTHSLHVMQYLLDRSIPQIIRLILTSLRPIRCSLLVTWCRMNSTDRYYQILAQHSINIHKLICEWFGLCEYRRKEAFVRSFSATQGQCFFLIRNIGLVTPKIIHFHYLEKNPGSMKPNNSLFNFESRSTAQDTHTSSHKEIPTFENY